MLLGGGGDHSVNLMHFVVPDHISDGGSQAHDFKYGDVVSVHIGDKLLGNNRLQNHGELYGYLPLLTWFKSIHNTSDGVGGTDGMQT